jgi:integrase
MTQELAPFFPNNHVQALIDDLVNVQSWSDFERRFLLGTGKSTNTNSTYLTACKQFYEFTGGLHPMQAGTPEWVEQWYDALPPDLATRSVKVAALRFMFRRIVERFPAYRDPFSVMDPDLTRKLSRCKKNVSEKDALTETEYRALLSMLQADTSLRGLQDYALIRLAVTSGMRAAELVSLRWENLSNSEGIWKATFIGKGDKMRTIQLEAESVQAAVVAFSGRFGRKPVSFDHVLQGTHTGRSTGDGISKSAVHLRIKAIAARARRAGILRENLAVSTHTMRHTCATRLVGAGVPLDAVQRHLGHSSINTTAVYLHNSVNIESYWTAIAGEAS